MLLHANQSGFYLNVVGYDHPRDGQTYADRNRLLINLQLVDAGRRWDAFGPLFYADEMPKLLTFLTDLLADRKLPDQLTFREPFVRIVLGDGEVPKDTFQFRFMLCHAAAPPWWTGEPDVPYPLTIDCTRNNLQGAVDNLAKQIRAFPVR